MTFLYGLALGLLVAGLVTALVPPPRPGLLAVEEEARKRGMVYREEVLALPEKREEGVKVTALSGECWLEVSVDGRGVAGIIKEGEEKKFTGKEVVIRFGNPQGVKVSYGGVELYPGAGEAWTYVFTEGKIKIQPGS